MSVTLETKLETKSGFASRITLVTSSTPGFSSCCVISVMIPSDRPTLTDTGRTRPSSAIRQTAGDPTSTLGSLSSPAPSFVWSRGRQRRRLQAARAEGVICSQVGRQRSAWLGTRSTLAARAMSKSSRAVM